MPKLLLWLQFAYSVWQFVRVAKFFRIPSALVHHTLSWLFRREIGKPLSVQRLGLIEQGAKWVFPNFVLAPTDSQLPGSQYFLQKRYGAQYLTDPWGANYIYIMDRRQPAFLCSRLDLLLPDFFIADVYDGAEGIDLFLKEGRTMNAFEGRVLITSSREHFLNQNFMRLISILPLVLQAKGFDSVSLYASSGIVILDQFSYPANLLWRKLKDILLFCLRYSVSRIRQLKTRLFVSTFLSTLSPKLKFSDEIRRNFYYVNKGDNVLLFGTSCLDHFDLDHIAVSEAPTIFNPYQTLSRSEYDSFERVLNTNLHGTFGIEVGALYLEHSVNGSCIKTFLQPENGAYYNFIDYDHLHYGHYSAEREDDVRKALKLIEVHGKMPVTCNYAGELSAVRFNHFVDNYSDGARGVVRVTAKRGGWVS